MCLFSTAVPCKQLSVTNGTLQCTPPNTHHYLTKCTVYCKDGFQSATKSTDAFCYNTRTWSQTLACNRKFMTGVVILGSESLKIKKY